MRNRTKVRTDLARRVDWFGKLGLVTKRQILGSDGDLELPEVLFFFFLLRMFASSTFSSPSLDESVKKIGS